MTLESPMRRLRRIGIVTTWFERGAAYVSRQFRDALARDFEVFVYARGGERSARGDDRWDTAEVTWDEGPKPLYTSALNRDRFLRWLDEKRIELVLFNEQRWWPPVQWCDERKIPNGAYVDYYTPEMVRLFGLHDFLITNTRRHHSVFLWHPQCYYVPWGTDVSLFQPPEERLVNPPRVTFFHSCGMDPKRKGTDLTVRAFARVAKQARLVIHTQVRVERVIPALRPALWRLQRTGALRLIHQTVPLPGLYHLGDVYVYPSRLEGIGLTICEAMAAGLPVICTDTAPMNEFAAPETNWLVPARVVGRRKDGYYWPVCEAEEGALAAAMQECVRQADRLPSLKLRARRYAEQHHDWLKNAAALPEILAGVRWLDGPEKAAARRLAAGRPRHRELLRHEVFRYFPGLYERLRRFKQSLL